MFRIIFISCIFLSTVLNVKSQSFDLTNSEKATIQNDVNFLTAGMSKIALPLGAPGDVRPLGKFAYALANSNLSNVWAAARYGGGKICAFGSNQICQMSGNDLGLADNRRLMQNCIRWITNQTNGPAAQSPVGLMTTPHAYDQGFTKSSKTDFYTSTDLVGVWFVLADEVFVTKKLNPDRRNVLKEFVQQGGGLIICNRPWYSSSLELSTTENGNQLLLDFGLTWSNTLDNDQTEIPVYNRPITEFWKVNALYAANQVLKGSPAKADVCSAYASLIPISLAAGPNSFNQKLVNTLSTLSVYPLCCNFPYLIPVNKKSSPLQFTCVMFTEKIRFLLPLNRDHPIVKAAKIFPGYPNSPRANVTKSVSFVLKHVAWQSTGLYIWPGSTLQAQVPTQLVNKGYKIQFNCHKSNLLEKPLYEYNRWPNVVDSVPIINTLFSFFTLTGGLLYLEVPHVKKSGKLETVTLAFTGELVSIPWFQLGVTTEIEWQAMIATSVSPWIEVESNLMVATINASYLSPNDNITRLAMFKDQVLSRHYDLMGKEINAHKERIVSDIQLNCGTCAYYAGYPVNGNSPYTDGTLLAYSDDVKLVNNYHPAPGVYWPFFHEFGHNFQVKRWTSKSEGEVTCNIFSLYIEETFPDGPNQFGAKDFNPDNRPALIEEAAALMFYLDLRQAFGWVAFKKFFRLFEANQTLTSTGSTPEDDNWLKYFSQTVKRNINSLVTEFRKPVSADAVRFAAQFPAWDKYKIIDCDNRAFNNSPCMTAKFLDDGWILFQMTAWAPINYTEALELKFVEALAPAQSTLFKFKVKGFWSSISSNSSTQTVRLMAPRRINNEDSIEFRVARQPNFNRSPKEVRVKIVNDATSKTIHLYERSLEIIR